MYNEQQIQAYLNRLHYNKEITLTREVLDELIYAHQCSIPFENLDVYDFQKEISLTEEALYDKFIVQRRGGYCFEMNGFFCGMLRSMGFDARPCLCRVMFGLTEPSQNLFDHRATIVTLDGKDYFCEVGLGGAMPPASMKIPDQGLWTADTEDVWHEMKGEEFSIRAIEPGWYGTIRRVRLDRDIYDDPMDRKERLEVMFTTIAVHEMDFTSLNYYLSHAEKSLFRCQRICQSAHRAWISCTDGACLSGSGRRNTQRADTDAGGTSGDPEGKLRNRTDNRADSVFCGISRK